jgi:citrate lyase subunit beta/citryl-CoA lyase
MAVMRSLLFVPANRESMVERAHAAPADVIVLDIEDSVPLAEKDAARAAIRKAVPSLKALGKTVHVRVNHVDTGLTRDDLAAAVSAELDGILYPKTEGGQNVRDLDVLLRQQELHAGIKPGEIVLVPSIETARGVLRCEDIATASTRNVAIALGPFDYTYDLGVARRTDGRELVYARRVIVHVAIAYGLLPLDGPFGEIQNEAGLLADAEYARSIGLKGKYLIHPNQIETVNRVFRPGEAELAEARQIVAAYEEAEARGHASVQVNGRMVDIPVVGRARALIAQDAAIGDRP